MIRKDEEEAKSIFDKLKDESPFVRNTRMTWKKAENAADWYRKAVRRLGGFTAQDALEEIKKISPTVFIGKMFMFRYDPKTKEKLEFWDAFPLIIPIEIYGDGFLGLNLHYLAPEERIYFLHRLLDFATSKNLSENTSLLVSYGFLKNVARYKAATPCIKRYLSSHIVSQIIQIDAPDWETAVFLPTEQFRKSGKKTAWSRTRSKLRRRRR